MNIKLNGSVFVAGEEIYFEDFEVAVDEDLPVYQFEEDDDDIDEDDYTEDCDLECDGNCYDCEYGDEDDEDDDLNPLEKLIEEYVEFLVDEHLCIDCVKNVLENFVYELISEEE